MRPLILVMLLLAAPAASALGSVWASEFHGHHEVRTFFNGTTCEGTGTMTIEVVELTTAEVLFTFLPEDDCSMRPTVTRGLISPDRKTYVFYGGPGDGWLSSRDQQAGVWELHYWGGSFVRYTGWFDQTILF